MTVSPSSFGVLGVGYVGLPLAVEAGKAGVPVVAYDVDAGVAATLNDGRSHVDDVPSEEVAALRERGLLRAATDPGELAGCRTLAICVPTPLSASGAPDLRYVVDAAETLAPALEPGSLVVLESTVYPGCTREVLLPVLARGGLRPGEDFHVCFSPERVVPGMDRWGIRNTPKLIAGATAACTRAGVAFYSRFVERMVPVSSMEVAEFAKILENAFRVVNIGFANEMALIADKLDLDIWEAIEAAATKPFGFDKFLPGPGVGGHCIPVDPQYLAWKVRSVRGETRLIDLAAEINAEMPAFVVGKTCEALDRGGRSVSDARVLVVGVAFKGNVSDVRESPAFGVIERLERRGAEVSYHDPHVPALTLKDGRRLLSVPLSASVLRGCDAAVVVTDHACIDYARLRRLAPALVDARNATRERAGEREEGADGPWIVKHAESGRPELEREHSETTEKQRLVTA